MLPRAVVTGLTIVIALAWAANVVVGFIAPARHDPSLNAIFAVVVGAVYALGRKGSPEVTAARKRLGALISGDHHTTPPGAEHTRDDTPGGDQ